MGTRATVSIAIAIAAFFAAAGARADEPASAASLFDRGLTAMNAGRLDEACPLIEKSYFKDAQLGALFTLAECEAKRGRAAVAVARYDEYLGLYAVLAADKKAKQGDRDRVARAKREALAAKIAELTLVLPPSAPAGTQVTRDGTLVPPSALGVPAPVEPGTHVISARTPDGAVTEVKLTLAPGEKKGIAVEVKPSADAAKEAAPLRRPNGAILFSLAGVGGAAAIAGGVLTGLAFAKNGAIADARRKVTGACPAGGAGATGACGDIVSAMEARATLGKAALGAFVGAGAAGAAALIYGLAGGNAEPQKAAIRVAPGVAGVWVSGAF